MENTSQPSRVRRYCKNTFIALALLLCMQTIFFSLNLASAALPREPIQAHIEESMDDPVFANIYDYEKNILGSRVSYDNNRYIISIAEQDQYDSLAKTSLLTTIEDYDFYDIHSHYSYWRYWHGWQFLTNLCLLIGPVSFLVVVVFVLCLTSTIFFLIQLKHYVGAIPACVFVLIAFFSTNIFGNFMGDILLAIAVFALVGCCGLLLKLGRSSSPYKIKLICLTMIFSGGLFCYLDFLSIPAFVLTLAVTSGLIAIDCTHLSFKKAFAWFVGFSALFMLGYLFTWASKWILVAIFADPDLVFSNVTSEIDLWINGATYTVNCTGWYAVVYDISPRLYALVVSLKTMFLLNTENGTLNSVLSYPAGVIAFVLFIAICIYLIVEMVRARSERRSRAQLSDSNKVLTVKSLFSKTAILYLPCLFVPVYIALMANHTIFHVAIFGYKSWAIVFALLSALFLWTAIQLRKSRKTNN